MRTKTTVILLLLALATTACGRGYLTQAGATSTSNGSAEPWGRTFLSTSVTEDGRPKALVEGTRISLAFIADGHRLGAQAGCNQMGGPASFEDGRLVVGDLATTDMGCDPPRHGQDDWLARFLTGRPHWSLSGPALTLDDGKTRVVLEDRAVADPDRPLAGTRWVVDTIVDGQSASSVPAGAEGFVVFGDDERFTGNTGCNGMGGTAVVDGARSTITFSEVITTKMACEDDRMRLERAVLDVLDGAVAYQIDADTLRLDRPDGHGLHLRASKG
jgi:heat shock protein HslJ